MIVWTMDSDYSGCTIEDCGIDLHLSKCHRFMSLKLEMLKAAFENELTKHQD